MTADVHGGDRYMAKKGNEKIIDALNEDRAYELAALAQYMAHHYEVEGMESPAIMELFKEISIVEMIHAEKLAERIVYLGGTPTMKPTVIKRGGSAAKMIKDDLEAEYEAIERYKEHIKLTKKLGDITTTRMLEGILAEEEDHANTWEGILKKKR
jgi:bacterioferritin